MLPASVLSRCKYVHGVKHCAYMRVVNVFVQRMNAMIADDEPVISCLVTLFVCSYGAAYLNTSACA